MAQRNDSSSMKAVLTQQPDLMDFTEQGHNTEEKRDQSSVSGSRDQQHSGSRDQQSGSRDQQSGSRDQQSGSRDQQSGSRDQQHSGSRDQQSGSRDQQSGSRDQHSGSRDQQSGSRDQQHSGSRDQQSGSRDQQSGSRDQQSGSRDQQSGSRDQQHSGSRDQQSGSRDQQSGSRDQQSGSRDQQSGSRDQLSGSRDQLSGSRDQQSGSRDQQSGSRDQQHSGSRDQQLSGSRDQLSGSRDQQHSSGSRDQHSGSRDQQHSGSRDQLSGSRDQQHSGSRDQQHSGSRDQQHSGSRDQQHSGSRDQQHSGSRDQQHSGSRDQLSGSSRDQQHSGSSRDQQHSGSRDQQHSGSRDQHSSGSSGYSPPPGGEKRESESYGEEGARPKEKKPWRTSSYSSSSSSPLSELKRLSQCRERLGPLNFSATHTVLIDVNHFFSAQRGVRAQEGRPLWQSDFVRMPCSPESTITAKKFLKGDSQVNRWGVIRTELGLLDKKRGLSVGDVEKAIMGYNPKYKDRWTFDVLVSLVKGAPPPDNYYLPMFPKIARLAVQLDQLLRKAVPLLQRGRAASITLSQRQISCLLANAFFCTFPRRNDTEPGTEYHAYPTINFTSLFGNGKLERKREKLRAIFHYFDVVTSTDRRPDGLVTFERRCLQEADVPDWRSRTEKMTKLHVTSEGVIEREGADLLQVDFACKLVGGGVLGNGLVQEEILFLVFPELIASRLFTEKLGDNECLIIKGLQQYSHYTGFSDSFEWAGPCEDPCPRDEWKRRQRQILAIDALDFSRHQQDQYSVRSITRELNKAYCGFKAAAGEKDPPDIATGNWGCGAFKGDPQLKALIQLMAAAVARRGVAFFTFRNERQKRDLQHMHHLLTTHDITVGMLHKVLEKYCSVMLTAYGRDMDLFQFVEKKILGEERSPL